MSKIRNMISVLLGLVVLTALAVGLAWLLGPRGALPAQQESPVRTPTPRQVETPTPTVYVEPTAPSEDWPTLTPLPTRGIPTPHGTPVVKPTPLPTPTSTPLPPLPLPPIPEGEPPEELWSILYLPLEDKLAVHGVLVDAQGRRWSDPEVVYDFRKVDFGPDTCLTKLDIAPTGNWLAVGITHFEGARTWLLNLTSQEPRFVSACEGYFSCTVRDWSTDGTAIILARNRGDFNPSDFVIVDVASDATTALHVPDTRLDHPYVKEVAFSPDGRFIAWTIEGYEQSETTQVWLTSGKGEQAQLLTSEAGQIWGLAWHPDSSQVAYSFAVGEQRPSVWLLSVDDRQSVPLVPSPDSFSNPAWAPDGLQVAMTQCAADTMEASTAERECNVSVLDLRSERINQIVSLPGQVYRDISWSPDGESLAFVAASDEDLEAVWLYASRTDKSYPVSGYVRPFSEYGWLQHSFAGER